MAELYNLGIESRKVAKRITNELVVGFRKMLKDDFLKVSSNFFRDASPKIITSSKEVRNITSKESILFLITVYA